jgi:hypothetical protein
MSKCGRTHLLEAMTAGEAPALEFELRAHAQGCPRCHHELSWLDSERRLFRQRAGRDEVNQLWQGVERRTPKLRADGLNRVVLALAVALLVVLGLGLVGVSPDPTPRASNLVPSVTPDEGSLQSVDWASEPVSSPDPQPCSRLTPGLGFHCGSSQSTVLASR